MTRNGFNQKITVIGMVLGGQGYRPIRVNGRYSILLESHPFFKRLKKGIDRGRVIAYVNVNYNLDLFYECF